MLYSPANENRLDSQTREALAIARKNETLRSWLEQHCAFQRAVRAQLKEIKPPPLLKGMILMLAKINGDSGADSK